MTAGSRYWIALLQPSGSGGLVQFRDGATGPAQTSAETSLTTLPSTWTPGSSYQSAPLSAYAGR